jgi:hypothetical protein
MKSETLPSPKWIEQLRKRLRKLVLHGDYKSALSIARRALADYPTSFECKYQYAKLLGDWADELPPQRRRKCKTEAITILRPLTRALSGKPPNERFGVCLNFYYQSEAFRRMYNYGRRLESRSERNGLFAQGLGACLLAKQYYDAGNNTQSQAWAIRSIRAWNKYQLAKEKYYFAHYSLALSFAIINESKKALKSLRISARLSQRKVTDWEFSDVLKIISRNLSAK